MASIRVEVVYAATDRQRQIALEVPVGTRVEAAVRGSGLLEEFTEIDLTRNPVGVFGRLVTLDTPLEDQDRVEIYRPLVISPTEARRLRAQRKQSPP